MKYSCKSLSKDDVRTVCVVGIIGVILAAVLGVITSSRWEVGLVFAVLAIPGAFLGGTLYLLLRRWRLAAQNHPKEDKNSH